jgi:hypothetical protein
MCPHLRFGQASDRSDLMIKDLLYDFGIASPHCGSH